MNCGLCVSYLAMKHDINKRGFKKKYCPGCVPRGENCKYLAHHCNLVGKGLVRFCYECQDFPCKRLKDLDRRYRIKYHMSMIENLNIIKTQGMPAFLKNETEKWRCPKCGETICCHDGLCLNCEIDQLLKNKKHRWEEKDQHKI